MIKCPNCGAELEFDPSLQKVTCGYCGSTFKVEDLNKINLDTVKDSQKDSDYYTGETYKCNQCGATLMTFDETAITFCSYCGSQAIIKDKMISVNNPDYVIPFSKTKEECVKAYKDKLSSFIFTPNYLRNESQIDKFRGIYMPYAVFNLNKKGILRGNGEIYDRRVGNYIYYDKYTVEADVDASYEGMSFDLVSKYYDNFSTSIPFDSKSIVPFNINYLHGYYADSCDVKDIHYQEVAQKIIEPDVIKRLNSNSTFKKYRVTDYKIDFDKDSKVGMFPVYFLATRDKDNKKVHYAAVNGQTGQVACDLPIDFKKYILISLLIALLVFIVINNFLILTPTKVAVFALVLNIINLFYSKNQASKINKRANHTTDIGFVSKSKKTFTVPNFETYGIDDKIASGSKMVKNKSNKVDVKYIYKEIIGIIISIIAFLTMQANDVYYYGAAVISIFLAVLSFRDLVNEHNLLTSNELPQLNTRGGNK